MEKDPLTALLLLEDGTLYKGKPVGKMGLTIGEICFNTGMTGYQEVFTDPSYYGQILVMTNAHIGNYGTKTVETESGNTKIAGMVCKNFTNKYSRPQANMAIQEYFEQENLVAIAEVDTRAIVKHIRKKGAMNAAISSAGHSVEELKKLLEQAPVMDGLELASKVSTKEPYYVGNPQAALKVAVLDYGVKSSILRCMAERGCYVKVFPADAGFADIKDWQPNGYFLSNGPGDPAAMIYAINLVKQLFAENTPLFGICLGHQLMALGLDIPTYKMHHGHRGLNHPVKNLITGRCEITSQNHGFAVSEKAIAAKKQEVEVTHINLNDNTIEGFRHVFKNAFSVQYHPEAGPGPHDARYLFDDFIKLMKN